MSADKLLDRLEGVRKTGAAKWICRCPAHDDRHASMSIKETEDGRTLVHCFSGCSVEDVLTSVGLTFADLFPEKVPLPGEKTPRIPRFNAGELLRTAIFESTLIVVAMSKMTGGSVLGDGDMARVTQAMETLNNIRKEGMP